MATNNLQSLKYENVNDKPTLHVLDQLLLPAEKKYIPISDVKEAWSVIRTMQIRGAPLIAIVACLGLAVDLKSDSKKIEELSSIKEVKFDKVALSEKIVAYVVEKIDYLRTSRPTAVNLFNAMDELISVVNAEKELVKTEKKMFEPSEIVERIFGVVVKHAEFMLDRDVSDNKAIGSHGAKLLLDNLNKNTDSDDTKKKGIRMITICNTGSLATADHGTALGVARSLNSTGDLSSIHALETRPYNQGSRLTAFEIMEEKFPEGILICDSAVGALMRTRGADACVVGADRVCANGDTANKIGTYTLSVVAKAHGVPFYVASPFTTLDVNLEHGDMIEIEERSSEEIIESGRAPKGMKCWNPAFDVTPAEYITGIITEKGVILKGADGKFDIKGFVNAHTKNSKHETL